MTWTRWLVGAIIICLAFWALLAWTIWKVLT